MIRRVTLCVGDIVFHIPTQKPIQITGKILSSGVVGYDFDPIMLTEEFFIKNGFTPTPGDTGNGFRYTEKDKIESNVPAYVDWWYSVPAEESEGIYKITVHGNGCTISLDRNMSIHELQAAMRICRIQKPLIV